jgi:hypothetical protein
MQYFFGSEFKLRTDSTYRTILYAYYQKDLKYYKCKMICPRICVLYAIIHSEATEIILLTMTLLVFGPNALANDLKNKNFKNKNKNKRYFL